LANYEVSVVDRALSDQGGDAPRGASFFGHDPKLEGLVPFGHKLPAHLVLTLDSSDQRVAALNISVGPVIRLVHPYYYSQGESFSYHHQGENQIEFTNFRGVADGSWPHEGLASTLPAHDIKILVIKGKPQRKWGDCSTIFMGNDAPTVQNYSGRKCAACSARETRLIASIPSRPAPGVNIWNNDFVFALFWFCEKCKAITTHNECD